MKLEAAYNHFLTLPKGDDPSFEFGGMKFAYQKLPESEGQVTSSQVSVVPKFTIHISNGERQEIVGLWDRILDMDVLVVNESKFVSRYFIAGDAFDLKFHVELLKWLDRIIFKPLHAPSRVPRCNYVPVTLMAVMNFLIDTGHLEFEIRERFFFDHFSYLPEE